MTAPAVGAARPLVADESASDRKRRVNAHFSSLAPIYHTKNYEQPVARGLYPDLLVRHRRILEMAATESGRALDIGCGSGRLLADLRQSDFEVVGVDYSGTMASAARDLLRSRGLGGDLAVGDIERLCFRDEWFDVVIAAGVLEYLGADGQALAEIQRILRPGGVAIVSVRNRSNLAKPLVLVWTAFRTAVRSFVRAGRSNRVCASGAPARWHAPRQLRRDLDAHGFDCEDAVFYHFEIWPRRVRAFAPDLCIRTGLALERFCRSWFGYFGAGYLVKARKRAT